MSAALAEAPSAAPGPRTMGRFPDVASIRTFVLAGDAVLTAHSQRTGKHFTYRVSRAKDTRPDAIVVWFVSVLTDGDQWTYVGVIRPVAQALTFRLTTKSKMSPEAPCVRAFEFAWRCIETAYIPADLHLRHEGKCGRCKRTLTTPASLDLGIGPECATKMGLRCDGATS